MHVHANLKKHQPSSQCCLQEGQLDMFCTIRLVSLYCKFVTLQLTCEKDLGMGLCTFNIVLCYPYTLFAYFLALQSLHLYLFF